MGFSLGYLQSSRPFNCGALFRLFSLIIAFSVSERRQVIIGLMRRRRGCLLDAVGLDRGHFIVDVDRIFEEKVKVKLTPYEPNIQNAPTLLQLPPADQLHQHIRKGIIVEHPQQILQLPHQLRRHLDPSEMYLCDSFDLLHLAHQSHFFVLKLKIKYIGLPSLAPDI